MPRSSRHKSHKQSKHGSREGKEHSESEKEDVKKVKDRSSGEGSAIRDSGSSEKRKLSKDSSSRDNGSPGEEFVGSKRRKEKADGRWTGEEDGDATVAVKEVKGEILRIDGDNKLKDLKPVGDSKRIDGEKSKHVGDSKSKSSRRHESGSEKKEDNAGLPVEKDESNSSVSRVESKRKSEKDLEPKEMQQNKGSKDKEWALEREKKIIQESKREKEASNVDVEAARKQGEERQGKRSRENTDYPIQDELRNPELEKELERRTRKRGDGSTDKDKYQDGAKESEDGRLSSRGERAKDGRYKDEKHKDGSSGDKHREDSERSSRHRDDKYGEDAERDGRRRDFKYGEDGDKYYRHKDNKYCEEDERDNRRKDDKYREDGERDRRQRDGKYREDGDRHKRQNDDKYREGDDRDIRHRDDKYREDADRDNGHRVDKYHEDGGRDRHRGDKYHEVGNRADRYKDDWHAEDGHVDNKSREEKYREDVGRDNRYREGMQREDSDKGKRVRDVNYRDEQSSRDRTSGKSDIKHLRDESNAPAELHNRKLNNRDSSPIFDDQSSRYKDDKGRRRTGNREDHGEIRPRSSTKEQNYEGEKKSLSSMRVELGGDRGRSNSRSTALEITGNHNSRQRNPPSSSSHAMKDQHRLPKHEESKNRDYIHEERVSYNVTSSKDYAEKAPVSRTIDKTLQKNDIRLAEFSAERHPKEDAHPSPLHLVDISPSSTSNDRRQLNRSGVRRNLDMEDSGRSGGSRDAKSPSQADGDNKSVSSPFSRSSNFSSNPRSLLPPPPPFRMGADSPLVVGSFDDDNRSKPNNRHRRIGDPTIGRAQGSPWRGVPNWPSPMPNGFIPFQHGPPQVGFHPVMQQFPTPPMFSIRPPSMELNQSGVPYHVPDSERISGHGRPLGWRHTVDDAIHGWDTGNPVFGEESHFYGRPNWDQNNRNLTGGRVWETSSGAMWKGHNSGASTELPSAPDMGDYSGRGQADEVWSGLSGLKAQNEEKHPNAQVESIQVDRSKDAVEKNALETPKAIPDEIPNLPKREDARVSHLYLSMLDVSPDLTEPELLNQCTNLVGMDQNSVSDEDDSKFLLVEEDMDATSNLSNKSSRASLFPTLNNSVLQKAMSLYKKTRVQVRAINGDKVLVFNVGNLMAAVTLDQQGMRSNDKPGDMVVCDQQEAGVVNSALTEVKMEMSPELTTSKIDEPFLGDGQEKSEAGTAVLNMVKVELDLVSKQQGTRNSIVEEKSSSPVNVERPDAHSLGKVVEVNAASDSKGNSSVANDVKCGLSLFSDFSKEAVLPESVESVNLSRIHQSPESTH